MVEGVQRDDKSNQWFGATVRSSGEDGIVLVSYFYLHCEYYQGTYFLPQIKERH